MSNRNVLDPDRQVWCIAHRRPLGWCHDCRLSKATRRTRRKQLQGVRPLSETVMPFGLYKGCAFTETPLGYLDWLAGQPWLYGDFQKRLVQYLSVPCIQQELDELFPYEDDGRNEKAFSSQDGYSDKWHGDNRGKEEEPRNWQPPKRFWQDLNAWDTAADHLAVFEDGEGSIDELALVDFDALREACTRLPGPVVHRLREACRKWHDRLRDDQLDPVPTGNVYRDLELGLLTYDEVPSPSRRRVRC